MAEEGTENGVNEFIGVVNSSLKQRFSNPVMTALSFSWLIINYKVLVIIFSGADLKEKIKVLDDYFTSPVSISVSYDWPHIYVLPLIAVIIYLFGATWLNVYVDHYVKKIKNLKYKKEKDRLHRWEDLRDARAEKDITINGLIERIKTLEEANTVLRGRVDLLAQGTKVEQEKIYEDQINSLSQKGLEILTCIGKEKYEFVVSDQKIKGLTGINDYDFQNEIDKLKTVGLAHTDHDRVTGGNICYLDELGFPLFLYLRRKNNP